MRRFKLLIRLLGLGAIVALTFSAPSAIPMVAPTGHDGEHAGVADLPVSLSDSPEDRVVKAILLIQQDRLAQAESVIDETIKLYPTFKLAQLIKGDLLMAHAGALPHMGAAADANPAAISDLEAEARARLKRRLSALPSGMEPKYLLDMPPEQKYALIVDTHNSRLYVFANENNTPKYLTDYYITIGKLGVGKEREGDQKTPIGVYQVTGSLPLAQVGDFYGSGAFPLSYPNDWDKQQGKSGHGIWLHGVPSNTYSRPPRASNGCVVLTNQDLQAVAPHLQFGITPVIITNKLEWVQPEERQELSKELQQALQSWEADWESRDTQRYLSHYSKQFRVGTTDYTAWAAQKQNVNQGKSYIDVKLNHTSIYAYPGERDMAVVNFEQDYRSNNLVNRMQKRQYWQREGNTWKIVYEGSA